MNHHNLTKILCFFTLVTVLMPLAARRRRRQIIKNRPTNASVIIFDITGVLFKENKNGFAKKIGFGTIARYTFTHWKTPGYTCLSMLNTMSCDSRHSPTTPIKLNGYLMPQCIVDLHQGSKTCAQTRAEITKYIEQLHTQNYFKSTMEKDITQHIVDLIFDPEQLPDLTKPIAPMVKLARQLKAAGYQLYLLANLPDELFQIISTTYPNIVELFDGKIISSQVNMVKPNIQIFSHFLETYQLNPETCVLIDEQEENIAAAQQVGITSIMFNGRRTVIRRLKQLGIRL